MAWTEDRLLWIFGSSRSGSTWLLRMLSDLDGVVPVDDPHLGHHLGVWRPIPLAWAACEEPPALCTLPEVKREEPGYFFAEQHRDAWWEPLRELIRARFEAQARELAANAAATHYVVKEPGSQVAGLCAELFPASKLVFLLRDGRDVVDSWLDAYRDGSWAIPGGAFPVSAEGKLPLIRWLASVWAYRTREVARAYESRPPAQRLLLRYEELRGEPATSLGRVAALLGIEATAGEVETVAERHAFERVPAAARGPRREIRRARPGCWRQSLSGLEIEAMHEAMGETLAEFGYPVEAAPEPAMLRATA
jgi:hypothetical protein